MENTLLDESAQVTPTGTICPSNPLGSLADSMLKEISKSERNATISPSCLYQAICLLSDITAGSTRKETLDSLGGEATARRLFHSISHIEGPREDWGCKDFRYSTGASIWLSDTVTRNAALDSKQERLVPVALEQVEMGTEEAKAEMGRWLSANTGGIYDEGPDTDASMKLVALSAMHLKDAWDHSFDEDESHAFAVDNKGSSVIDFMRDWEEHSALTREGSVTVSKNLTSGINLVVTMPPVGTPLKDYVQSGAAWQNIQDFSAGHRDTDDGIYNLHMPKFNLTSDGLDITSLVRKSGITEAFMPSADFSPITTDDLMVEKFIQNTRLEIDEEGLEGASYVMMVAVGCAAIFDSPEPDDIYIDRSFAVSVISTDGIPLFVGAVVDPTERG